MFKKGLQENIYKLNPVEETLVAQCLADVEVTRVLTFEQVKKDLAQYIEACRKKNSTSD